MNFELAAQILYEFYRSTQETSESNETVKNLCHYLTNIRYDNIISSTEFKINFKYFIIGIDHEEKIKSIIGIVDNAKPLTEMFIFDDGEVHFENKVYSKTSGIFKYKSVDSIIEGKTQVLNPKLTQYDKKLSIDKLFINDEFINTNYGRLKVRVMPGDWIIKEQDNVQLFDYLSARDFGLKSHSTPSIYPETLFERQQVEFVAKWWAGFLPGISPDKVTNFNDETKIYLLNKHEEKSVSQRQYDNFVQTLVKYIYKLKVDVFSNNYPFYVKLGRIGEHRHPDIIDDALKICKIKLKCDWGLFPFRSQMTIFDIGLVIFNEDIIYSSPKSNLFTTENTDFTNVPSMLIIGCGFRIVQFKMTDLQTSLFKTNYVRKLEKLDIQEIPKVNEYSETLPNDAVVLYAKLYQKHFKDPQKKYLDYTNAELVKILQNTNLIRETFSSDVIIIYDSYKKNLLSQYYIFGEMLLQTEDSIYYEYKSKPTKIFKSDKSGVVCPFKVPIIVEAGDLVFLNSKDETIDCFKVKSDSHAFTGYLCDAAGNLMDNIPHPLDTIETPLLAAICDVENAS